MFKKRYSYLRGAVKSQVRSIPNHSCSLPLDDDPADSKIYQGICVNWRRQLWKWATVDAHSPQSKRYLKSIARIYQEEMHHLKKHPNIIHPFSKLRYAWEIFMVIEIFALFIMIPIIIKMTPIPDSMVYLMLTLDIILFIDIILWFWTGYYDKQQQTVVLKFTDIARRYIFSYFLFDVFAAVPMDMIVNMNDETHHQYWRLCYLFKVVRMYTLFKYIRNFSERRNLSLSYVNFFCFTIALLVLIFWTSSTIIILVHLRGNDFLEQYTGDVNSMLFVTFSVTRSIMNIGVTAKDNKHIITMIFYISTIFSGSVLSIVILSKVLQVYEKHSNSRNKFNALIGEVEQYVKYKKIPPSLKRRIIKYIDFKFQRQIFRDDEILNNLSYSLRHNILLETCQRMVKEVEFFGELPQEIIIRLVSKLRCEIYLANDVIVSAGLAGNAMYFIHVGTVAVFTANGKEICHLSDGDHFGEIALVINALRVATVIAVKECELYRLSRKDFQEAVEPFPAISKKIRDSAMSRLEDTLSLMSNDTRVGSMRSVFTGQK